MFIQVIQGHTKDADGLRRQMERWDAEVRPGAVGFLGSTGGITDDGEVIVLARFADDAAAKANSERVEQGNWWAETEKYFDAEPIFRNCTDCETFLGGGTNDAGFVQVMISQCTDRARAEEFDRAFTERAAEVRPDLLGGVRAWDGDTAIEAAYFSSEEEARAGEAQEMPEDLQAMFEEWQSLYPDIHYLDLRDPILR